MLVVDKTLTLLGGYEASNWLAAPTPATVKATLDASADTNANGVVLLVTETGNLTASGLTIRGSYITFDGYTGADFDIGGIDNLGHLTLSDVDVVDNLTDFGAGIFNRGWLTATNVSVQNNTTTNAQGGGIVNFGTVHFTHGLIAGNTGGGFQNRWPDTVVAYVADSVIRNNLEAGGVLNTSGRMTIERTAIVNNVGDFAGGVGNGGVMTMTQVTISGNHSTSTDSTLPTDTDSAAGVFNRRMMTIRHSTIVSNTADSPVLRG